MFSTSSFEGNIVLTYNDMCNYTTFAITGKREFIPMTPSLDCHCTHKPLELIDTHSLMTSKIEHKVELFENLSRWPNVTYAPAKDMHFTMIVVQHFFSQCLFNIRVWVQTAIVLWPTLLHSFSFSLAESRKARDNDKISLVSPKPSSMYDMFDMSPYFI
jgi:hypothetical protein